MFGSSDKPCIEDEWDEVGYAAERRTYAGKKAAQSWSIGAQSYMALAPLPKVKIPVRLGGVGKGVVNSAVQRSPYATRLARGLNGVVQRDVDSLVANLLKGNLNPGIGTRALGNGFFELRGANAGRVIIKSLGKNRYDIVGKFQGHALGDAANSATIQRLLRDY